MSRRFLFSSGVAGQKPCNTLTSPSVQARAASDAALPQWLLLGTQGCHLCDETRHQLTLALQGCGGCRYLDIAECQSTQDSDALIEQFGQKIPLIVFIHPPTHIDGLDRVDGAIVPILARCASLTIAEDALFTLSGVWHEALLETMQIRK